MVTTDVTGGTCCPRFRDVQQKISKLKSEDVKSICLSLSLIFIYVIAYNWE